MLAYFVAAVIVITTAEGYVVTGPTACASNTGIGCAGLPNGDYPACFPECQEGIFITCSNKYRYVRDCPLGWYVRPSGERFTQKLVFDPQVKRCERKASYCPRWLDNLVES